VELTRGLFAIGWLVFELLPWLSDMLKHLPKIENYDLVAFASVEFSIRPAYRVLVHIWRENFL
jgi:hypothetical protein